MSINTRACITRNDTSQENTRKRRRNDDDEQTCDIDRRPFIVQPSPLEPFARPRTFTPICLLTRAQLPLAYLDTLQSGSRLFAACIQILDACHDHGNDANILIVEDEKEKRFYAVERTQRRQYALCQIGSWVKREDLERKSRTKIPTVSHQVKRQALQTQDEARPWWMVAATKNMPALRANEERAIPTLSKPIESLHDRKEQSTRDMSIGIAPAVVDQTTEESMDDLNRKPADEVLEELAKQYLDALYISRTPIAYFVKGPLIRARTALSQSTELSTFLRGIILAVPVHDKKFREVLPEMIKELPILNTPDAKPKSRRKRKFKPKRDKSGLFVDEKDFIEQWWRKDDSNYGARSSGETLTAAITRRCTKLRSREMYLQVVLMLETMALEASSVGQAGSTAEKDVGSQTGAIEKKQRKKKELNIASVLDDMLDRLNIWYEVEGSSPSKSRIGVDGSALDGISDDLKSFAAEVVIPFYASRIPDSAYSTSKKLGGPTAPTPARRKSSSVLKKPGEPASRQPPEKKARRPLERVSTDTLNMVGKRPPSLQRSATDSDALAPSIKHEMSVTSSLDDIPYHKLSRHQPSQTGTRKSALDQMLSRQVDFAAMAQTYNAKRERGAEQREKMLRTTISNVKKPNRESALEERAKEVDAQFAKATAKGRSHSAVQSRKSTDKHVTSVSATPRRVKATPAPKYRHDMPDIRDPGALSTVPSSSARTVARAAETHDGTFAVPQTGHRPRHTNVIDDTPSRSLAKYMPVSLIRVPGTLLESPTATRSGPILQTPAKAIRMPALLETPVKGPTNIPASTQKMRERSAEKTGAVTDTTVDTRQLLEQWTAPPGNEDIDVYAALGWNDD